MCSLVVEFVILFVLFVGFWGLLFLCCLVYFWLLWVYQQLCGLFADVVVCFRNLGCLSLIASPLTSGCVLFRFCCLRSVGLYWFLCGLLGCWFVLVWLLKFVV